MHKKRNKSKNIHTVQKKDSCGISTVKRVRRGGINHKLKHVKPRVAGVLKLFSTNGAGVKNGKVRSLNAEVQSTGANIVTLQETHCNQKGKIKMDDKFIIFEAIRKKKGGGTMIAVHEDLNPTLIEEYNDEFELLVVEIETKDKTIRVISGYGPQENWEEEKRLPFFLSLEKEIEKAELAGKSVLIEIDANSKLGPTYIPEDPHTMTPNGALLAGIIERHDLTVGNSSNKCKGKITRKRVAKGHIEASVIDFVIYSNDLKNHMTSMHVDEERVHVLTRITKTKNGKLKVKESDHHVIVTEFNCKITPNKKEIIEVYNLNNKECQAAFKKYTSETNMLSSCIDEEGDIDKVINNFMKKLDGCIAVSFKKRRVGQNNFKKVDTPHDKMRHLKGKTDDTSKKELIKVQEEIAKEASENFLKLKEELDKLKPNNGKINSKQLWKLKKRLCPRLKAAPSAMNDSNGNLITSEKALKEQALDVYSQRLKGNKMEPHLKDLEDDKNSLCELRVKLSKNNKTEPWTMEELKEVLKNLKKEKARDPEGHCNELFKETVAGNDLLKAILKIINMIKKRQVYPKSWKSVT